MSQQQPPTPAPVAADVIAMPLDAARWPAVRAQAIACLREALVQRADMVPHGPDAEAFDKASHAALAPHKLDDTLAFMFETRLRFHPTAFAINGLPEVIEYATKE